MLAAMRRSQNPGAADDDDDDRDGLDLNGLINFVVCEMHQPKREVLEWPWHQFWADVAWLLKRQRLQREAQQQAEAARTEAQRNPPPMPGGQRGGLMPGGGLTIHGI